MCNLGAASEVVLQLVVLCSDILIFLLVNEEAEAMSFQTPSQTSPQDKEKGNRSTLTGSLFSSDVLWLQQGYSSMTLDPGR